MECGLQYEYASPDFTVRITQAAVGGFASRPRLSTVTPPCGHLSVSHIHRDRILFS